MSGPKAPGLDDALSILHPEDRGPMEEELTASSFGPVMREAIAEAGYREGQKVWVQIEQCTVKGTTITVGPTPPGAVDTRSNWPELLSCKDDFSLSELAVRFDSTPGEIAAAFRRRGIAKRARPTSPIARPGIEVLRAVVRWADQQHESHWLRASGYDDPTAHEITALYGLCLAWGVESPEALASHDNPKARRAWSLWGVRS